VCVCVCVCGLNYPPCNAHAPYCRLWPHPLYSIFPHYLRNGTIFVKTLLKAKCVFWFSLRRLYEAFLILRITERDMIKNVIVLHVTNPLFLPDFNETWIFSTDFLKIIKYKISWKSVQWEPSCFIRTDRRDMTKLIIAFHNFAKEPKMDRSVTRLMGLDATLSPRRIL
jgi:hypothetical protein